jgi:disulfide bond formation protein DsbB
MLITLECVYQRVMMYPGHEAEKILFFEIKIKLSLIHLVSMAYSITMIETGFIVK